MGYKPYDAIVVTPDGETVHMELKIADIRLHASDLRDNQHKALKEITDKGARGVVVCYCKRSNTVTVTEYVDLINTGAGI